ncbi:MAG: NADH-quinone oxidoreductase subunit L, partial [Proteobacteria bacterium]|nr:NADH-quinone oxidoreductase subunit L [Pseudomonadota bacterium]
MITAIVFLPLFGAIAASLASFFRSNRVGYVLSVGAMLLAMILGWLVLVNMTLAGTNIVIPLASWIEVSGLLVDWRLKFDALTAVMIIVITTVSAMVHVYSIGYMADDQSQMRFMAYLGLFTFAMLMLVTADNLVQLFFGWEGVGLASYLLIGFWYHRPAANAAAMKAFIVNRVGDFAFMLGILFLFALTGSVQFDDIFAAAPTLANAQIAFSWIQVPVLELAGILLFIGAMGKSAQLGLHTWLPDAMEGPTPVSALIHAATMVTAGVFLVCRMSPMLEFAPITLAVITIVGAATALFAATIGITQFDIKRVIAYSTCSQLGYMFFAAGLSAYPAAMFHLTTHAFFKALLFLGSGSVIHALQGEQDMRNMGGIWYRLPFTYTMMWIGSLALAGLPFFAGYYSKDFVLEVAWAVQSPLGDFAWYAGLVAAGLTAFYSWRLLFMTFHGKPRTPAHVLAHIHESPPSMSLPLFVLALGAILSGWMFYGLFIGDHWDDFWGVAIYIDPSHHAMHDAHYVPLWVKEMPVIISGIGIGLAAVVYLMLPSLARTASFMFKPIYILFYRKYFFDEIYAALFVRPAVKLGWQFWQLGDRKLIDGVGPDGVSAS